MSVKVKLTFVTINWSSTIDLCHIKWMFLISPAGSFYDATTCKCCPSKNTCNLINMVLYHRLIVPEVHVSIDQDIIHLSEFLSIQVWNMLQVNWRLYVYCGSFTLNIAKQQFQSRTMAHLFNSKFNKVDNWSHNLLVVLVLLLFPVIYLNTWFSLWSRNSPLCQHVPCQERGSPSAGAGPWPRLLTPPAVAEAMTKQAN